jgi:hypothetical protein
LSATRNTATVLKNESVFGNIGINETASGQNPFAFKVDVDIIEIERFKLTVRDQNKNEWTEFIEIPLKKDLPELKDFQIADGKIFTVAKGGTNIETVSLGRGNGDGIPNPGESIVILVKENDKYWRTELTGSDKFINPNGINSRISDSWTDFDHVGASAKYSVPLISSDCPQNHAVDFFAEYWTPQYPYHIKKQGVVKITIQGNDKTPPILKWLKISGDNLLQARILDGSKVHHVKAKFIFRDDPTVSFESALSDDGSSGDKTAGDNVFTQKISGKKFGFYRVVIECTDSFGNQLLEEAPGEYFLH